MKKLKRAELLGEIFTGTSLSSSKRENKKGTKQAIELTPKISIVILLIFAVLVCSVAYYITENNAVPHITNANAAQIKLVDFMNSTTAITTSVSMVSTTITTTVPVVSTTTTTTRKRQVATISTTAQETTTTTTIEGCGGDLQKPCDFGIEKKCNEDLVIDANDTCQIPTCAPSVSNGRSGCGAWALNYCK